MFYAGNTLQQKLDPLKLLVSRTGRLYHPITNHKYLKDELGLLHPHIGQKFDLKVDIITATEASTNIEEENLAVFSIRHEDKYVKINFVEELELDKYS